MQLKSENVITHLLDFLFDVLGHSAGKPLNLERARITTEYIRSYDIESANTIPDEYNFRWLLINIYYLCLKYTPGLAKNWYVDCKSKQTRLAVEGWTEKYFSPLVIADTLDDVAKWAEEQEAPPEDEKPLIVKVSKKSKEVSASYEVDEMMMQIVIRLLPLYPLEGIRVDGVNRVAVSEKKWQSWLMITQGVITFSVCFFLFQASLPFATRPPRARLTLATERQHHGRPPRVPPQRDRRAQGTDRVRDLLQHRVERQEDAGQALPDVQAPVPQQLSVQVVREQQSEHVSAVSESV